MYRWPSSLRLNAHFHSLFRDGVFARNEDGALDFHELDEPSPEQVADVTARTAKRIITPPRPHQRLCAMIPPPRSKMIRFHAVFAPNAKLCSEVVPKKETRKLAEHSARELADAKQTHLFDDEPPKPKRHAWAWLIKKVFLVDVTECPECGGRMKWQEACTERRDIHRVLAASGLAPRAPPQMGWTPLGQLRFSF